MTKLFDRAFVALGVDADELAGLQGRTAIYLGMMGMAIAATTLVGGIVNNLATPVI